MENKYRKAELQPLASCEGTQR